MHVDSQLSSLLISLLDHYQVIELHGLGTIERQLVDARISDKVAIDQHLLLLPPQLKLRFKRDDKVSVNTLFQARADKRLDDQSYERLLTFVNTLSQHDDLIIDFFSKYQSYLPSVALSEVAPDQISHADLADIGPSEKMSQDLTEVESIGPSDEINVPSKGVDQKQLKERISIPSEDKKLVNRLLPLFLLMAGICGITLTYKQCSTKEAVPPPVTIDAKELTRAEDDINPLTIDVPTKIFDNPRLEKYRHVLTKDIIKNGCKITVGSFKEERNAINMMERVLTEGYNSEIMTFEGGSRVIITFDCLSEDLDDYLVKVKENIAPNAWYLQPQYEPEEK